MCIVLLLIQEINEMIPNVAHRQVIILKHMIIHICYKYVYHLKHYRPKARWDGGSALEEYFSLVEKYAVHPISYCLIVMQIKNKYFVVFRLVM